MSSPHLRRRRGRRGTQLSDQDWTYCLDMRTANRRRVGAATSPRVATEPRRRGLEQPHRLSEDGAFAASPTTSSALTRPAVGGSHRPNSYKRRVGRNRCPQSAAHHRAMTGEVAIVLAASSSRPAERSRPTAAGRAGRRRRATPRSHVRIAERAARRGRERAGIVGRPHAARRSGTCRRSPIPCRLRGRPRSLSAADGSKLSRLLGV